MSNFITLIVLMLGIVLGIVIVEYKQSQVAAKHDAKQAEAFIESSKTRQ